MPKLSLFSQVGCLIYNFGWEKEKSQVSIKWKLSQVINTFTLHYSVKGIIPKTILYNNCILYHDATKKSDSELFFT